MTHSHTPDGPPEQDAPEFHLPPDHWPLPELSTVEEHPQPSVNRYVETRDSADFQRLRKTFRNFAFPVVITVLVLYFVYVLLSTYAVGFMKIPAFAGLNLGFWLSFAMFPITWIATWMYVRHADQKLDPLAEQIRAQLESKED